MNIGESIKYWRNKKGLTQKQLAESSNISEISIRKYEAGDRIPKIETIDKISSALDLPIALLKTDISWNEYQETEEYKDMSRKSSATESIKIILEYIYRTVEEKHIFYKSEDISYFLVGKGKDSFIIHHEDIQKLLQYSVASFPFLIDELKDTRSESIIKAEILEAMEKIEKDQDTP